MCKNYSNELEKKTIKLYKLYYTRKIKQHSKNNWKTVECQIVRELLD